MQQRFAVILLIRLAKPPTMARPMSEARHSPIQATGQVANAHGKKHLALLHQLRRWLETVLPPHASPLTTSKLRNSMH